MLAKNKPCGFPLGKLLGKTHALNSVTGMIRLSRSQMFEPVLHFSKTATAVDLIEVPSLFSQLHRSLSPAKLSAFFLTSVLVAARSLPKHKRLPLRDKLNRTLAANSVTGMTGPTMGQMHVDVILGFSAMSNASKFVHVTGA